MFQIKICGITGIEDAQAAAAAGADAVGLNFYAQSPRHVTLDQARAIVAALPAGMVKVGVFVDTPAEAICQTFDELGLDFIQLHGDQPPEFLPHLGDRPVMKAFRVGPTGLEPVFRYLRTCESTTHAPQLVLLDAYAENRFGGTGSVIDSTLVYDHMKKLKRSQVVLAGGLNPSKYCVCHPHRATGGG